MALLPSFVATLLRLSVRVVRVLCAIRCCCWPTTRTSLAAAPGSAVLAAVVVALVVGHFRSVGRGEELSLLLVVVGWVVVCQIVLRVFSAFGIRSKRCPRVAHACLFLEGLVVVSGLRRLR